MRGELRHQQNGKNGHEAADRGKVNCQCQREGALLAAALIVRNEESVLVDCFMSLNGRVDCVHVLDTGSTDGTLDLLKSFGVPLIQSEWAEDFSQARNEVLSQVSSKWTLSIDADERFVVGDAKKLAELLSTATADAFEIEIDNEHEETSYSHKAVRIFKTTEASWIGKVHEQVVSRNGFLNVVTMPRETAYFHHIGYKDRSTRNAKSERNMEIATAEIEESLPGSDGEAFALLDLARSYIGAEKHAEAIEGFEKVRSLYPGTQQWIEATDFLARVLLASGNDSRAIETSKELRNAGASSVYCDWLEAQALVQLGDLPQAWKLLENVKEVIDTSGRRHSDDQLIQLKNLVLQLRMLT